MDFKAVLDEIPCFITRYVELLRQKSSRLGNVAQKGESALNPSSTASKETFENHTEAFNMMILTCIKARQLKDAWSIVKKMVSVGLGGDLQTTSHLFNIVDFLGRWDHVESLYDQLNKAEIELDPQAYNSFLAACMKHGQWTVAEKAFKDMVCKSKANSETYSLLIATYEKGNQWSKAVDAYVKMVSEGVVPTISTYNSLMNVCRKAGELRKSLVMFQLMQAQALEPDSVTYNNLNSLIISCSRSDDWELTCNVFKAMKRANIKPDSNTFSALSTAVSKTGDKLLALDNILEFCERQAVLATFRSVICMSVQSMDYLTATETLDRLRSHNFTIDWVTYSSIANISEKQGARNITKPMDEIGFQKMLANGTNPFEVLSSALGQLGKDTAKRPESDMEKQGSKDTRYDSNQRQKELAAILKRPFFSDTYRQGSSPKHEDPGLFWRNGGREESRKRSRTSESGDDNPQNTNIPTNGCSGVKLKNTKERGEGKGEFISAASSGVGGVELSLGYAQEDANTDLLIS